MSKFELLKDNLSGMSNFQHDEFVTKKEGGTLYGQYKQALREATTRYRNIINELHDIAIEEEEIKLENNPLKKSKAEFNLEFKKEDTEHSYQDFYRFYSQAELLKNKLNCELTEENRYKLEAELFEHKCKENIALEFIAMGHPSKQSIEFLYSLPKENILEIEKYLKEPEILISWYKTTHKLPIIDFKQLAKKDVQQDLLELKQKYIGV